MKRTVAIRLQTTLDQGRQLSELQTRFSQACSLLAPIAVQARTTNHVRLHHLAYYEVRRRFPDLGAQMTCKAIAIVARSLKAHRANGRDWVVPNRQARGSVHFDKRTYRLLEGDKVSLFTLDGRIRVEMRVGSFQRGYLERGVAKEADLVYRNRRWYFHLVLDLPDVERSNATGVLGVDLGENVAAATSGGTLFGGGALRDSRDRFLALRRRLQSNGSRSARQLLARVSGREMRHARHVNHEISAAIVREATETGCATIVLEDLTHIRVRIKARKRMRTRLHRWAWRQLQGFIEYKAQAAGVAVLYVDPAYTSRTCSVCGERGIRLRHRFSCRNCGIFAHSDRNAARNLAKIGVAAVAPTGEVMRPHVAARADYKPPPSGRGSITALVPAMRRSWWRRRRPA